MKPIMDSCHGSWSNPTARLTSLLHRGSRGVERRTGRWRSFTLLLGVALAAILGPAPAQGQEKTKIPVIDKLSSGSNRQAFSGTVQSLDLNRKLLNLNTVQGGNTEIFPVKKDVRVTMAGGEKIKLTSLAPGMTVIIYYEQKGDRRKVNDIVVLKSAPTEEKKTTPPS